MYCSIKKTYSYKAFYSNPFLYLSISHAVVFSVRIRDLSVPPSVELGEEDVVLNCDYEYEEREKLQLEVKWYFGDEPTPFFQWLPAKEGQPQIIGQFNLIQYLVLL